MTTLALDPLTWDLTLDAGGNIATVSGEAATAQDVASALRLYRGEYWYDLSLGIPYFQGILGRFPPLSLIKSYFVRAAMSVPGVTAATCFISSVVGRQMNGQVIFTTKVGAQPPVGF